ncbi:hypothetical protein C8F04DRAFT_923 [Mycena alexandri]|uniref:Gfd2/YDR514C-like C-terminal domain-containing protein n=1 Tax=Mycena alexandri TaxID=1745969 RepID=A0AAD6XCE6_9AGAR|nr:hypothetical protein C8F04DRAFT_923 [Mycena alexandri]
MAIDAPPLVGYYRATDILHHYHQSIKGRDAVQLQKILSHDAVLHPRHPFAAEGAQGIQAYIGTFHDGQSRLLFSSKQVEYLRYFMHAMKLTENLIPLPYSDCMFLEESVAVAAPTVYESLSALSVASKTLGRMNQVLKEKPLLVGRRTTFERVRTLWNAKQGVWCALAIDAWELDWTAVSDVGWSLVRWEAGTEISERGHLVVKDNQTYKPTELEDGAEHEVVSKATLKRKLIDLFSQLGQHAPIFLLSNDSKGDLKYLRSNAFQVPLSDVSAELPDTMPTAGVFFVEPAELFDALTGSADSDIDHNLRRICKHLNIDFGDVRNAGTDAESALQALRAMASGPQLDDQRTQRWPCQTDLEVKLKPWEDDPKHADLEGLFPPQYLVPPQSA